MIRRNDMRDTGETINMIIWGRVYDQLVSWDAEALEGAVG
jgi:hypothetical protein